MAHNAYYWDETNESKMGRYVSNFELKFLENAIKDLDKNIKILILGCGSGKEAKFISDMGFKDITGTDPDSDYLKIAKNKVPGLKIKVDTAPEIGFRNESFDLVIALEMIGYFKDTSKFLGEVSRVLKPDGKFIFQTTNKLSIKALAYFFYSKINKGTKVPYAYAYTYSETKKMLENKNFEIKAAKGFNWNVLYRASNSILVDICANFEKIGLNRLISVSPWIMVNCIKRIELNEK